MIFRVLLEHAKEGKDEAIITLLRMYQPLINKYSFIDGEFDEDLYQEQTMRFLFCIRKFDLKTL